MISTLSSLILAFWILLSHLLFIHLLVSQKGEHWGPKLWCGLEVWTLVFSLLKKDSCGEYGTWAQCYLRLINWDWDWPIRVEHFWPVCSIWPAAYKEGWEVCFASILRTSQQWDKKIQLSTMLKRSWTPDLKKKTQTKRYSSQLAMPSPQII